MIGLGYAAATRAPIERGGTGSGRPARIEQRAARYLSCWT